MVGADGQPQWPYDTQPWQGDSPYSRGEWGEDVVGGPLWSPVRCPFYTHLILLQLFISSNEPLRIVHQLYLARNICFCRLHLL